MAKLYPLVFIFFMLASGAAAQTPDNAASAKDSVGVGTHAADTLLPGRKPTERIRKADSALKMQGDSQVRRRSDSLEQQHPDTILHRRVAVRDHNDSAAMAAIYRTDSLRFSNTKPGIMDMPAEWTDLLKSNAWLNFYGRPVHVKEEKYESRSYDGLFYLLVGLLFFFAIIKLIFEKYLGNLLTLFFRVSMRQQQIREQVLQSPFPSLLLNLLFVLSAGLYASFLIQYYHYADPDQFWSFFLYGSLILTFIYLVKFIFLKVAGWIFNIKRAVETYLFIVFMTNKIIGIFLLPFLVILSFSDHLISTICITVSLVMIGIFYFYRIAASYKSLRKEINISGLHFFLYLCAFEIAPLLLIYKVLLTYLGKAN